MCNLYLDFPLVPNMRFNPSRKRCNRQIRTRRSIRCWCWKVWSRIAVHPSMMKLPPRKTVRCSPNSLRALHTKTLRTKCWSSFRPGHMPFALWTNTRPLRLAIWRYDVIAYSIDFILNSIIFYTNTGHQHDLEDKGTYIPRIKRSRCHVYLGHRSWMAWWEMLPSLPCRILFHTEKAPLP